MKELEILTMSKKELSRLEVVQQILNQQISQVAASKLLKLTERQVRRLVKKFEKEGAQGLLSKRRNRPSNNRLPDSLKTEAMRLVKTHYSDFGPTLACEKLALLHGLVLSKESLRKLMIEEGLWKGKKRRYLKIHPQRERRACLGELVQTDGSKHAWFEDRAPACCLLVIVDDATSEVLAARFEPVESTQAYFNLFKPYVQTHGRPLAVYHDKHGIFQVNIKDAVGGAGEAQFERVLDELGIESIAAHSPQAKGRVERVFNTLQDRLVKELRLKRISELDSANAFLPEFIQAYNQAFAVEPRLNENCHRCELPKHATLELIFSHQYQRTLSKSLTLSFNNTLYQIQVKKPSYAMRGAKVLVCLNEKKAISILYKGKALDYITIKHAKKAKLSADSKTLNHQVDLIKKSHVRAVNKPAPDHPWRKYSIRSPQSAQTATAA